MAGITERNVIQIDICEKTEEIIKPIKVIKIKDEIAEIIVDISYRKTRY